MEENEKPQLERIEKYGQAHLERIHAISGGATKTALAWIVALVLIWWQQLEPKLTQIRVAQESRRALAPASTLGLQRLGLNQRFAEKDDLAKDEQLELPFSIKFKLPPEWLPTLWLLLAFALGCYMLTTRRRILRLAIRGAELLETDAKVEPPYVRRVVGEAVWWLAPLTGERLRQVLGWDRRDFRFGATALPLCLLLLVVIECRVMYIGFCVGSYLLGIGLGQPRFWLVITAVNCMLFVASVMVIWRWFVPISEFVDGEGLRFRRRRHLVSLVLKGSAISAAAFLLSAVGMSAFASLGRTRKTPQAAEHSKRRRKRRKHARATTPPLAEALYVNPKTGTVHTITSKCKSCFAHGNTAVLKKISPEEVRWNSRPGREHPTLARVGSSMLISSSNRGNMASNPAPTEKHPHAAHRTFMLEQRALDLIHDGKGREACVFLTSAILATPTFGLKSGIRLYDLLAGLTVRYNMPSNRALLIQVLEGEMKRVVTVEKLVRPAQEFGPILRFLYRLSNNEEEGGGSAESRAKRKHKHHKRPPKCISPATQTQTHTNFVKAVVADRIKKWQDMNSCWYRHWSDTKTLKWSGVAIT